MGSSSTQKILQHGRMVAAGAIPADPIKESIGLELDMINILYVLSLCLLLEVPLIDCL